jgi:predicted ester cyclase
MASYPDGRFEIDDMIAEGDKALIRWTFYGTFLHSGKMVTIPGMDLWQFNPEGKIAEAWFYMDMSDVMPKQYQNQPAYAVAAD